MQMSLLYINVNNNALTGHLQEQAWITEWCKESDCLCANPKTNILTISTALYDHQTGLL